MASEDVQTNLRLPAALKDRLVASAAENNRSLSAEVASRLERSYSEMDARKVLQMLEQLSESVEIKKAAVEVARFEALQLASALSLFVEKGDLMTPDEKTGLFESVSRLVQKSLTEYADSREKAAKMLNEQQARIEKRAEELGIELDSSKQKPA